MEEKIVEIGEYTVRMKCDKDYLEITVIDALGEDIDTMIISDEDDDGAFDDEDDKYDDFDEEHIHDN